MRKTGNRYVTLRQEMEYLGGKDIKNQLRHAHKANKDDMTNKVLQVTKVNKDDMTNFKVQKSKNKCIQSTKLNLLFSLALT